MADATFDSGCRVLSSRFGFGTVEIDKGPTVIARFEHGIEECDKSDLQAVSSALDALSRSQWDPPLELIHRLLAEAIQSVNDTWGVFSRSRIELLPHQLWVCRQVNDTWPTRWLVADDVGLGKTIEAGMILWPLLANGTVRRLLIVCPAHLVEQWQYRLRTIFDIRLARYSPDADTDKSDFWGTHPFVVASLHTLRLDRRDRHKRILEADSWDLVVVDEAHHLNADEEHGFTLGYRLLKKLVDNNRVASIVFFTGTPHRGKNYGFLALLHLLRPDLFDLQKSLHSQLPLLSQVMIRNNKSTVTDITGKPLFKTPCVHSDTYSFSRPEGRFYELLTQFIVDGEAYASGLDSTQGRAVMLVLIAMQKLASSSTAAIQRAINKRLARVETGRRKLRDLERRYCEAENTLSHDDLARLEEDIVALTSSLKLMENEEPRLRQLLEAAEEVKSETKIVRLLELLEDRFNNRTVLFFTEYKATQALLMSALMERFGTDCVAFINGEDRLDDVTFPDGRVESVALPRDEATARFNSGEVRFLISTEAGGEGIDLQENCHTLVHVDLPWNPMRLHQRVGRLNRYGQTRRVDVLSLRNPDTVESLIWEKLNTKLEQISMAFGQVMEEPEDLLQLVLGMTSPSMFRRIFSAASKVPRQTLSEWFDRQTSQFGGQDVIDTVQKLVGNAAKFDFRDVSNRLPKVDLPDLRPFMEVALALNGRRARDDDEGLSFLTPDAWRTEPGVYAEYRGMRFDRRDRAPDAARRLLGVGHKVVNQALQQARRRSVTVASLPSEDLKTPLVVFYVRDRVTASERRSSKIVAAVELNFRGEHPTLLRDWQLIKRLNALPLRKNAMREPSPQVGDVEGTRSVVAAATSYLESNLASLDHSFRHPFVEVAAVMLPDQGPS